MTRLADLVKELHARFSDAGIPHAFGGALALAYGVRTPRGTADIDVNLFVPVDHAAAVFEVLPSDVAWNVGHLQQVEESGQVRILWGRTPLDLFFNTVEYHEHASRNVRTVPFEDGTLTVLAPDDLAVFKAFFDRSKDWVDIEAMLDAGTLDVDAVAGWLARLLGPDDGRIDRLRRLAAEVATRPDEEPIRRFPSG